jgi:hypothetical protein
MRKVKIHAIAATKYSTMLMAGLSFGCLAGMIAFLYGTNLGGMNLAHAIGSAGGSLAGVIAAGIASLPFGK